MLDTLKDLAGLLFLAAIFYAVLIMLPAFN